MPSSLRTGTLYALGAFGMWGVFPLYFRLLDHSGAIEILGHRVLWSLAACAIVVAVARKASDVKAILRDRRLTITLTAAAIAVGCNWGIYIYAVNSGQVIEASLGYFINPLVTVVLGVAVLHERLRVGQWIAVGVGFLAVVVLTIGYGHIPLIALSLALSFGLYGLLKNRVGGRVDALSGLTTETLLLSPVAIGIVAWFGLAGRETFLDRPPLNALLLASAGVVTVVPLLCFAGAARRIPLSTIGLLQYLTPSLQLLCGIVFLNEHMPPARWFGFALVWLALITLTADGFYNARRRIARAQVESISAA